MRCDLSYRLLQLKLAIQDQARRRPHHGGTVGQYFIGSGSIHTRERIREVTEAMEIMDLNTKLFHLWIQNELTDPGDWPRKVYDRLLVQKRPHTGHC